MRADVRPSPERRTEACRTSIRIVTLAAVSMAATGCVALDTGGVGAFDRAATATLAVTAAVDGENALTVFETIPVSGVEVETAPAEPGPPTILRDPFSYAPEAGTKYQMLLAPSVPSHSDPDLGAGQFSLLYLHEIDDDVPAASFPSTRTERGSTPIEFLDCLVERTGSRTRWDALVLSVGVGRNEFSDCQ